MGPRAAQGELDLAQKRTFATKGNIGSRNALESKCESRMLIHEVYSFHRDNDLGVACQT
jgi:hypothetical protein